MLILSQLFCISNSTYSETICILFSRCHRQLEQCHSPCLMTGITEPCICILRSLQDSTASHFMVCNLHFGLGHFPCPFFFFFPRVWWGREGVLVTRSWLSRPVVAFFISSATLELSVQLWQRGALLKDRNFPCIMKRCGTLDEESGELALSHKSSSPRLCPSQAAEEGRKGKGPLEV